MKKKLGKLTKTGNILLVVSFLAWLGFVACVFIGLGTIATSTTDVWETINMSNQLLMAEVMVLGSAAMPLFFVEMFSAQAKGKMGGMVMSALLVAAWLVYVYKDTAVLVFQGATGGSNLTTFLADLVVPLLAILSILLSNRPLAIIAAIASLLAMLANASGATQISTIMKAYGQGYTTASFRNIRDLLTALPVAAEIVYGLGMFFGLLGVKKEAKEVA